MNITKSRTKKVLALSLAAATSIAGFVGFSATAGAKASSKPPCQVSVFHPMKTTYSGLRVIERHAERFGNPSQATYNPYKTVLTTPVAINREQTKEMSVNASVEVEASAVVASVRAQAGVEASKSVTISSGTTVPVRIPPRQFGWVQAEVGTVTVTGTVTQVDMICNKQYYQGPITITTPINRPYLVPHSGAIAPR